MNCKANKSSCLLIAGDHSSCFTHIQEFKTAMMTTLSEITGKMSKLEKRTNEMISNKDEENKHVSYPLPDYAGMLVHMLQVKSVLRLNQYSM